ncbi:MAG: helix-turn-helix domain-containing protein [Candidatus Micrarchaeaceae archaeon]|jgi:DNA-binding HxlR family transcriptional regulator
MDNKQDYCPTLSMMHVLGKKWTIPIIEIFDSTKKHIKFNAMQAILGGISPKNLSRSLKELSDAELIEKHEKKENGILHTEYYLTAKGLMLKKFILDAKKLGICIYGVDSSCVNRKCSVCISTGQ